MLRATSVISLTAVREALLDAEAIRRMAERDPLRYWEWMRAHSAARDRADATMRGNGELQPQANLARLERTTRSPPSPLYPRQMRRIRSGVPVSPVQALLAFSSTIFAQSAPRGSQ